MKELRMRTSPLESRQITQVKNKNRNRTVVHAMLIKDYYCDT
jgi:hypothetical protein